VTSRTGTRFKYNVVCLLSNVMQDTVEFLVGIFLYISLMFYVYIVSVYMLTIFHDLIVCIMKNFVQRTGEQQTSELLRLLVYIFV